MKAREDHALDITTIQTASDVAKADLSTLSPEKLPDSLYAAIVASANHYPNDIAIKYILDGECQGKQHIPFSKKLVHLALKHVKGKTFAEPYREISFSELAQHVTCVANALNSLGVTREDVVSIVMPNFPEMYYALWGASTAGIANPINPLLDRRIIKEIILSANSKVLIALGPVPGSDIWEKIMQIKDMIPSLKAVISVFGDDIPASSTNKIPVYSLSSLLKKHQGTQLTFSPPKQTDDCAYFHTGGTTGLPKLAKHTHLNQLTNAAQVNLISPITAKDTIFVGLPIFHVNAAVATGIAPIMQGTSILLASPSGYRGKYIMQHLLRLLDSFNVAFMMGVPTVYAGLLADLEKTATTVQRIPSMKLAISGAAPLSKDLQQAFIEKTGIPLIEGYGSTESSSVSTLMPTQSLNQEASVGLVIPGSQLVIANINEAGTLEKICDTGEVGEILIAGNNVFAGYLDSNHNKGLHIDIDGTRFVRTGDLGKLDQHGYLSLAGRKKELIIRGGHNIDPKMIEDVATQHPDVYLAAAIPRPDNYAGELPVLYATLKQADSLSEQALLDYLQANVPERAAIPKYVRIIKEMPLTAVGKLFKPALVCEELTRVLNAELNKPLADYAWQLNVQPDKTFGVMANIILSEAHSEQQHIADLIKQQLANYSFNYRVIFEPQNMTVS